MTRAIRVACAAAAAAVAAAVPSGCAGAGANTIVLYNGQHPQLTTALVQAFSKRTGIAVDVRSGDGIVLADQLLQEGRSSPADVYMTENSPELMNLEQHGLLSRLPARVVAQVPAADSSPAGEWVGVALRVSSLAYDPARVAGAALPASILELARPAWRGRIAIAPTDSDFPPLVGAVIARFGEAAALRWLQGLKANAQIYQNEEAVLAAVNDGSVAAGLVNQYYWYRLRLEVGARALRSRLHYFASTDPGSVQNIAGAAVLASTRHRRAADAFVAFLVSPAGQRILASSYDFEYPARPRIAPNRALPPRISAFRIGVAALGTDQLAAQLIRRAGLA